MRSRQSFVLDTLRNVQGFLDDNAQLVGPSMAASRRSLEDVVLQLTLHAVDQGGGEVASRAETARQRVLRKTLRTAHMRPIAEVARQKLRDVPEFAALEMPPASFGGSRLVAAASVMADAAALHAPVFNAVGLPDDSSRGSARRPMPSRSRSRAAADISASAAARPRGSPIRSVVRAACSS
jgi:hypothetical protein